MQQDLVSTLSSASAVVAHLKQTRDALTEDNKAKNEQIAGLIAQAQRMKAAESAAGGGGAGGVFRKASVRHRASHSLSLSGGNTPRRVNSPGGMMR
jgi:ornithine carbamoyltransferase